MKPATFGGGSIILLFLEPSTRTRISFEVACHREGLDAIVIQGKSATSLEKEETLEDTFLNLGAMGPVAIVVRAGDDYNLNDMSQTFSTPVINAGWGVKGHPTQALLDTFAIFEKWGDIRGKKLLIIGDVRHSRVAQSHFELAPILGYHITVFASPDFQPQDPTIPKVTSLKEGLEWCDAVMALRTQKERHGQHLDLKNFNSEWGLNSSHLKLLKDDAIIMHPGPVNWGIELAPEIKYSAKSVILKQVEGGVYVRQALLRLCREGRW